MNGLFGHQILQNVLFSILAVCWLQPRPQEKQHSFTRLQDTLTQQILNLSDNQVAAIDAIATELSEHKQIPVRDGLFKRGVMREHESAARDRCLQLLTEEQRHRDELLTLISLYGLDDAIDSVLSFASELELTEQQQAYFDEARKKQMVQRLELLEKELKEEVNEERAKQLLRDEGDKTVERTEQNVKSKLTPSQRKRFVEMRWRYAMMFDGIRFFNRPEVQELLEFTDEEKADIKARVDSANQAEDQFERAKILFGESQQEYFHSLSSQRIRLLKQLVGPPIKADTFMKRADPLKDF